VASRSTMRLKAIAGFIREISAIMYFDKHAARPQT
jgi:hypothetical protein